jgi:NADH dehydrogenase FAD-containing subunit
MAFLTTKEQVQRYHEETGIMQENTAIVIVGAGWIGVCTAYHLFKSLST